MTNSVACTDKQHRLPFFRTLCDVSHSRLTLLRWHTQLHTAWGNPLHLNHWPCDEEYKSDKAHWMDVETISDDAEYLWLDDEIPADVGLYELSNLLIAGQDAVRLAITTHNIPYQVTPRRQNGGRWTVELKPTLQTLMALPPKQGKSLTRNRAAWAILAIKAGLWAPDTGYLLSPTDARYYRQRIDRIIYDLRSIPTGSPEWKDARSYNRCKVQSEAFRRLRIQKQLYKHVTRLDRFDPMKEAVAPLWREAVQEGEA